MIPIPLILSLAQFAPSIMQYFGAGKKSTKVVEMVANVAQQVTGAGSVEEAVGMIQANSDKQFEFRQKIMEKDAELEAAYLKDVDSARTRDSMFIQAGIKNVRGDMMFFLAVAIIFIISIAIWVTPDIPEWQKGIATLILGRFLGYLDNIYNFEFGTTRSSSVKNKTIENLSKEE